MENTPNLSLPYIMPSQAQKHVTHNEALRALDILVQLAVLDRDLTVPPSAPDEGDRHIVAAAATDNCCPVMIRTSPSTTNGWSSTNCTRIILLDL